MPSVCIAGVGAIGGWLASLLDAAGWDVRLLARGAGLAGIREHGLRVSGPEGERVVCAPASDDPADLGPVDYLILAIKGYDLFELAPRLAPLVGERTALVTAMNGLQWWFTDGFSGPLDGVVLPAVDPDGGLRRAFPVERVVGMVVHASAEATAPGQVRLFAADRLIVGEPDGAPSTRADLLGEAFRASGVRTEVSADIRLDVWRKLWGNMSMSPLTALTRATTGRVMDDAATHALAAGMMTEMAALGAPLGLDFGMTPEARMATTRKLGDFRTSMQRDAEAGRPLELSAILTVLVEIADRLGQPAPMIRAVHGLARQLDLSLRQA